VLENTQDYEFLAAEIRRTLAARPGTHGVLIRRHGLYTWGKDLGEAKRHVEILEFLFEVEGRLHVAGARPSREV
jgi:methylthioribulose-1-phosphate dehydratase